MLVAQTAHAVPAEPHAAVLPPPTQLPADEQQPPRHGWLALHEVVHWPSERSHAKPAAQSLALVQPHLPLVRQAVPVALPTQLLHCVPTAPHTVCDVPG